MMRTASMPSSYLHTARLIRSLCASIVAPAAHARSPAEIVYPALRRILERISGLCEIDELLMVLLLAGQLLTLGLGAADGNRCRIRFVRMKCQ